MSASTAIFLWLIVVGVFKRSRAECQPQIITCPCGTRDPTAQVTIRLSCEEMQNGKYPCNAFQDCETCQDGFNFCRTCPTGKSGLYCREGHQCPKLQPPKGGIIQCAFNDVEKECTGSCNPGYAFSHGAKKITLKCNSGIWSPYSTFPQCKPTGECDIEVKTRASYSCRTKSRGTSCLINCLGNPPIIGRFFCVPGLVWNPPLPYCVAKKEVTSAPIRCNCRNGGICDPFTSRCRCPSDYEGRLCQDRIEVIDDSPKCNCQNGGICHRSTSICTCPPFYEGKVCEKRKYNGQCILDLKGVGSFNCTYINQGISCDIRCPGYPPINDRFSCAVGIGWNADLPHCVLQKEIIPVPLQCACRNGGTCNPITSSCECPPNYGGKQCESKKEANQCGVELMGAGSHKCQSDDQGFYCDIKCIGSQSSYGRYYCIPGEDWKPPLPYCAKRKLSSLARKLL